MLSVRRHGPITRVQLARTVAGRPLYRVSTYLVGATLIDSGPPATARALTRWAGDAGVARVVHTHHHEDHTGGSWLLRRHLDVEVYAPPATAEILRTFSRIPFYRRVVWGRPHPVAATPFAGVLEIDGMRLEAIPTPGHADDHHCLFDHARGWLFSGDLFVHPRVRYLRREEDPWQQLEGLRRVRALGPTLLVCAHAGIVRDADTALARRIEFWERLAEDARRLVAEGHSIRSATRRLLGPEGGLYLASLGDFSKRNLVAGLVRGPGNL
ncbi:MAG: MBL fold metallo-hydrolase [Acidobacteria bacterium]|nr:MAG: MBL fold metallo-hydrolase [Acidobacteriota bacterium]